MNLNSKNQIIVILTAIAPERVIIEVIPNTIEVIEFPMHKISYSLFVFSASSLFVQLVNAVVAKVVAKPNK